MREDIYEFETGAMFCYSHVIDGRVFLEFYEKPPIGTYHLHFYSFAFAK
jgi:hypothetical protein